MILHRPAFLRRALLWAVACCAVLIAGTLQASQSVSLTWDAVSDPAVVGYRLLYGTTSGQYTGSAEAGNNNVLTVPNLPSGQTYYFVVVTYNDEALESAPSFEVSVTVDQLNQPPVITLTGPANGANFSAPAAIKLTATASDADGSVVRVEFYNGAQILGSAEIAPYSFDWSPVAAGTYSVSARAYDNQGGLTVSDPVSLIVNPNRASYVGTYSGGSLDADGSTVTSVSLSLTKTGRLTGRIARNGTQANVTGALNANGTATITVRPPRLPAYTLVITLGANNSLAVSSPDDDGFTPLVLAAPATIPAGGVAQMGRYTMLVGKLSSSNSTGAVPTGTGFATMTVSGRGVIRIAGRLADNQPFAAGAQLLAGGQAFVTALPYSAGRGIFAGAISFAPSTDADATAEFIWTKAARVGARPFTLATWAGAADGRISAYKPLPASAVRGASFLVTVAGADLPDAGTTITFTGFAPVAPGVMAARRPAARLNVNSTTGLLSGTFLSPGGTTPHSVLGVLYSKDGTGGGYFVSAAGVGDMALTGAPSLVP